MHTLKQNTLQVTNRMRSQQRLFDVLRNRGGPTKVYGRDEELGLVQDAFERVAEDECQSSEVVLVHGPSGCGKSAIVKALRQWTKDECGDIITTFFGTGKYDQLVNNEPFAAIVAASNELCENVLKAGPHIVKRFNDRFDSMVDGDATVLSNAIPALTKLLQEGSNSNNNNKTGVVNQTQDLASATQAFTRFKQLWRSLLLAIVGGHKLEFGSSAIKRKKEKGMTESRKKRDAVNEPSGSNEPGRKTKTTSDGLRHTSRGVGTLQTQVESYGAGPNFWKKRSGMKKG